MTFRKSALAAALLGALMACGTTEAPSGLEPGDQGRVRFVNLITDPARTPVDVVLENLPFGVALAYTSATPPTLPAPATALYSPVLAGTRTLEVRRTADPTVVLLATQFDVVAGQDRTIFATGGTAGGAVSTFITVDVIPTPPATETRMRVVNLSQTTGTVDVFVTASGADLAAVNPDASSVAFQGSSSYFAKVPASYVIRMVPAGTAPASRAANVVITIASASYAGGTVRTIVAADNAAGSGAARGFVLTDR